MFVKPMMATIIAQAPSTKPVGRKPARPSSFHPASVKAAPSGDVALAKRRSLNAPSPSPVPKSRPTSLVRSPAKSPTKQLSAASSASASRTGTPSNARVSSASAVGAARARNIRQWTANFDGTAGRPCFANSTSIVNILYNSPRQRSSSPPIYAYCFTTRLWTSAVGRFTSGAP
ncbi:hypothetical protein J3459_011317 [Metarhizium acridum]|nr:hypothetical protein J3459_011317 [Metarhizium acridum]